MKKINNYLLTHHPLLWNTRIVWVLLCNVVLHLLFFLAGLASISAKTISSFYGVWSVGGGSLITFSVLCSLLVIIVWLVFYLRNNAFKHFYRIGKWYLAKEFLLILIVVLSSISYFHSFNYGIKTEVRSITGEAEFVNEINAVNRAMVYLPQNFNSYFLLNNCSNLASRGDTELVFNNTDTAYVNLTSERNREIKAALLSPDAYSYRNYCELFFSPFAYPSLLTKQQVSNKNIALLQASNKTEVREAIVALQTISDKYAIEYKLSADTFTRLAFAKNNKLRYLVPDQKYIDQYGRGLENDFYFPRYDLVRVFDFINDCQTNPGNT
ncbi:MAG: hypothetical protein V4676_11040, partial [Bacteroidota bacterium]